MNPKTSFILVVLFLFVSNLVGQEGYFQLRGRIYNKNKETLSDVKIEVYEGAKSIGVDNTSLQGVFNLRFKLNKEFIVQIEKTGYATKKILVDSHVPNDKKDQFFDLFNLIILDETADADVRSRNGLPVSRYYYNESFSDFIGEKITNVSIVPSNGDSLKIKYLQNQLESYKALIDQQKELLNNADKIVSEANIIRLEAQYYADSVMKAADKKSPKILDISLQDTTKIYTSPLDKVTKDLSKKDFEALAVDEEQFKNKKTIQQLQNRVKVLSNLQNKTGKDSLELKKDRLSIRKELFDQAKLQLEMDRLKARTKEDSMMIEQRESQLTLMQQEMYLAEQEIESISNELKLKDLEIRNKNIMILSFIVGSFLLLIILAIIYYNYRDKKRINRILEYQNQELEKLSIVASETSNAVAITDRDGTFTWINQGYTRLYGYELHEVTGENPRSLVNINNEEHINKFVNQSLSTGKAINYEFETKSKTGEKIWVQTTLTPILDADKNVSKLIVIDSDISEMKQAEMEILKQSRLLAKQNTQIMDSINYAKRIQDAVLPAESLIKSYFPDSFIYFKPRDIVSGDFYWFSVQDDKLFVAAVDCTGHGVPGAFMSLIGNSLLNHIVNERKIFKPSDILKELNNGVNQALSQRQYENEEREDGMDITICRFDKHKKEVQVACANHTALFVKANDIVEIEGDEISIGESYSKNQKLEFTNHIYPFNKEVTMYLFSDGYQDQIGGPRNKKFLVGNFKHFLLEHQKENMNLQFDMLNDIFQEWKGNNKQTDDVLVMGIRLSKIG